MNIVGGSAALLKSTSVRWGADALYRSGVLDLLQARICRRRVKSPARGPRICPFSVLLYHRVNPDKDRFFPAMAPAVFDAQMGYLARNYKVLSLGEIVRRVKQGGEINPLTIAITFDDGYRDNFIYAHPVLKKYGLPATLFVATGFIGTGRVMWNDQVAWAVKQTTSGRHGFAVGDQTLELGFRTAGERISSLESLLEKLKALAESEKTRAVQQLTRALGCVGEEAGVPMLGWAELRRMSQEGWEIGSHTANHAILSRITAETAAGELRASKAVLERELSLPVDLFAYPNGKPTDFNATVKRLIHEAGYRAAVTTIDGLNGEDLDFLEIHRAGPWESSLPNFAAKLTYQYWKAADY